MVPYDQDNPLAVLAFVLCPVGVFTRDADEAEAVRDMLKPIKAEAARRFFRRRVKH